MEQTDFPQDCALYCDVDMDADEGGLIVAKTEKWNISITKRVNSSLSCKLLSNNVDTHTFSPDNTTATAQSRK